MKRLNKWMSEKKAFFNSYIEKNEEEKIMEYLKKYTFEEIVKSILIKQNNLFSEKLLSYWSLSDISYFEIDDKLMSSDILGLYIMSKETIGSKNKKGMVFTPINLLSNSILKNSMKDSVFDPCAGSGNFLIEAAKKGCDVSGIELEYENYLAANATLNYILESNKEYVKHMDFFDNKNMHKCNVIGNPPWGIKNFMKDYGKLFDSSFSGESFEAFILKIMNQNLNFSFVLPNSILHRKRFKSLRRKLMEYGTVELQTGLKIKGVNIDVVILSVKKSAKTSLIINGVENSRWFYDIDINPFEIWNSFEDILKKNVNLEKYLRENKSYIGDKIQVKFMGIVTGNNEKFLREEKNDVFNEPIYRGKNILNGELRGKPLFFNKNDINNFQQVNKKIKFKQKKIIYRFIGKKPEFLYDKKGIYTLNTLNCIILKKDVDAEKLVEFMNSELAWSITKLFTGESIQILLKTIERIPYEI